MAMKTSNIKPVTTIYITRILKEEWHRVHTCSFQNTHQGKRNIISRLF